jgi:hypothetical protein
MQYQTADADVTHVQAKKAQIIGGSQTQQWHAPQRAPTPSYITYADAAKGVHAMGPCNVADVVPELLLLMLR